MVALRIAPCSYQAAEYAVMNWHYSKRMPMPPLAMFGVWEGGAFVGSVLFGRGSSPQIHKSFGVTQTQICELVRVALREHESPVTRIVSLTLRMVAKSSPGLRLFVSFADPEQGHAGGIYKGGNWIYYGESASEVVYLHNGRWKHKRELAGDGVGAFGTKRDKIDRTVLPSRRCLPKHRYAYPLDAAMADQIKRIAHPYPSKQSSGEKGSPRGTTTGEGGSIPTSPHLFDLGVPHFPELPWSALRRLDVLAPGETEPGDDAQIGFAF